MDLSNNEKRMLKAILSNVDKSWNLDDLLSACNWNDQAHVAGAGLGLEEKGFLTIEQVDATVWSLGEEGLNALQNGLLERKIWNWLLSQPEQERTMKDLQSSGIVSKQETGIGIGLLKGLGCELIQGAFVIPDSSDVIEITLVARNSFIEQCSKDVNENDIDPELLLHFKKRKGLIESASTTVRTWKITKKGKELDNSELEERLQVVEITPELLQGEQWLDADFKSYDVNIDAPTPAGGRPHPMMALIERIRNIFLEMGFDEIDGDYVQTAGWNMDALFIPQDHPAREMQDTFYLTNPEKISIEDRFLDDWTAIHEHGGETGSSGWGGKYSTDESQKSLLRTHTTVNTVRYLAETPDVPCRVFGIGRVFRKETIDRTHLPEFHQIEGIIMEPGASLPMLVTTLKTFYEKMGYPEVRVRPAYFPYTEPSLEVEVKWRGQWLELGGAGIFRPEVTEPLGCKWPVCAWGMGLERLAMLVLGLDDIRQLYISDLEWLRNQPLL
ncbi:MAG: phenylalanine--tRNA ligase subunit alpha [Candidatus Thalassarchaeaceae archaeon]|nr:phenylalanine--tRNA ligase subunit alpha [Candidatus Thalassarchaeaceae archaeon]